MYVPVTPTCIEVVVAPVLQDSLPVHPVAVNVAFSPSQQIVLSVEIFGATGIAPFVTTTEFEALLEHSPTLQVAVYVPSVDTTSVFPVPDVDQTTVPPTQAVEVKVTVPVSQIVFGPSIAIVGGVGLGFTSTVTVPVVIHWSFETVIV
jgi:hypothetical protein